MTANGPKPVGYLLVAVALLGLTACNKNSTSTTTSPSPTAPTTPVLSGLTINGPSAVRTGSVADYTATASFTNGSSRSVMASWASSDASVGTVDGNGRVSGQKHGVLTLSATYEGQRAAVEVMVVNDYGGQWIGRYQIRACDQSGVFKEVDWCGELGGVGSELGVGLSLDQSGPGLSAVSGVLTLGLLPGAIAGTVTGDGRLNLGGTFTITTEGITFEITVGGWETHLTAPGEMRGRFAETLRAVGFPGNAYQENELTRMSRVSSTPAARPLMPTRPFTWNELFSTIRRQP